MSGQQERDQRKALLLRQIQQQRLDLAASHRHWLEATSPIDRGWQTLKHLRSWAMVGSGVMAIWSNAASASGAPGGWSKGFCVSPHRVNCSLSAPAR